MKKILVVAMSALLLSAAAFAAEGLKLDGITCLVAGSKPAKAEKSVEYKGAKVFFCCDNCPKAFEKDTAKFATKANAQLVATKQFTQVACPFSGKPTAEGTAVKVGGSDVSFCCMNCKGAAEKAGDEALEKVFADAPFAKGFKIAEKK